MNLAKRLQNGQCGLRDRSVVGQWRLPGKNALENLIDNNARDPALPAGHPFTGVQSDTYWSSTPDAANTSMAWYVGLSIGYITTDAKTSINYVWPVRDGR